MIIKSRKYNLGFADNFLEGLNEVGSNFDFYCYCDQDDVWHSDKIERAVKKLQQFDPTEPSLYASCSTLVNADGSPIAKTQSQRKIIPSFKHALVQNIAGGNSMLFNAKARRVILDVTAKEHLPFHDWWTYILIAGMGGNIFYDTTPALHYRQHGNNSVGGKHKFIAVINRLFAALKGDYQRWNETHIEILCRNREVLTSKNNTMLDDFIRLKRGNLFQRLLVFATGNFVRLKLRETTIMLLLVILKRL